MALEKKLTVEFGFGISRSIHLIVLDCAEKINR